MCEYQSGDDVRNRGFDYEGGGQEWKEEMQQCKDEDEWMRKAEDKLDKYYQARKMSVDPKYEQKKKEKEAYGEKEKRTGGGGGAK